MRRRMRRARRVLVLLAAALVVALFAGTSLVEVGEESHPPPAAPSQPAAAPASAAADDDAVIENDRLQLRLGASEPRLGALTIIDRASGSTIGESLGQEIVMKSGLTYRVPDDVRREGEPAVKRGVQTPSGPGQELHFGLSSLDGAFLIDLYVTLPDEGDTFYLQSSVRAISDELSVGDVAYFRMPAEGPGRFDAGEATVFLSDATALLRHDLYSDGAFEETIGIGSPVYVAGPGGRAIVLAWLDEPSRWPAFRLEREAPDLRLGFETGPLGRLADELPFVDEGGAVWSPRLLFDVTERDPRVAFDDYKRVMAALYPEPPLPGWFGPQWDSYWVYDLDITEANTLANTEVIDAYFKDLGPWSIIFDAGWYLDSGLPGSAPDVINYEKFPNGLEPVISYLHSHGIHSILYFSAPYVDDRVALDPSSFAGPPAWMALSGFIERYPSLVKSLTANDDGPSFIYDFLQPGMQDYLRYLMRLYLNEFGGDGILLDLVGEAGPAIADFPEDERAPGGRVPLVARQSMEVYASVWQAARAAKTDALVEGSWMNPMLSRQYAQTWRYGDEVAAFSFPYPYSGLVQHIDYAVLQRQMLGVRPHIGYLRGPGTAPELQRAWMGAALALGAQFALAVDFTEITPQGAEAYRSFLAHYKPFSGVTFFGPGGLEPAWFATARDGVTYIGVLNREDNAIEVHIPLSELGLANGRQVVAYEPDGDTAAVVEDALDMQLAAQSFRFFVLRDTPGEVWGSRRTNEARAGDETTIDVQESPLEEGGSVIVYAPGSRVEVEAPGFRVAAADGQIQRVTLSTGAPARIRIFGGGR